jgi:hypothetical protein
VRCAGCRRAAASSGGDRSSSRKRTKIDEILDLGDAFGAQRLPQLEK